MIEYKGIYDFTDFEIGTGNKVFDKYIADTMNEILPLIFKGYSTVPDLSICKDGRTLRLSLEEFKGGSEITFTLDDLWEVTNAEDIDSIGYTDRALKFANNLEEIARKIKNRNN